MVNALYQLLVGQVETDLRLKEVLHVQNGKHLIGLVNSLLGCIPLEAVFFANVFTDEQAIMNDERLYRIAQSFLGIGQGGELFVDRSFEGRK